MTEPVVLTVPAFSIPYSRLYLTTSLRLNQFQAEVYRLLERNSDVLVTAPTGGGKTLTLLLSQGGGASPGFVAVYPNNTLLMNQLCTVEDMLVEHFGAKLVDATGFCSGGPCRGPSGVARRCECVERTPGKECVEPLTIYRIDGAEVGDAWNGAAHVALLLVSGRYIVSQGVPKREVLYGIARKVLRYRRKGGVYTITFTTPDTYLLLMTGAYRDFDGVGKALHNMLLAIAEGRDVETVLRRTGVLARGSVDETVSVVQRLLNQPLFIDEFHLYGPYEVDALYAILSLYKQVVGKPVVFSSATPADDILAEVGNTGVKPVRVTAQTAAGGQGFPVRGDTSVTLIPVRTTRRGISAYFEASDKVPDIVLDTLVGRLAALRGGRALLILERLWMVAELARALNSKGLGVECIASIVPREACRPGGAVIVGSEATTQGVNLGKVVLGATGGTSSEDVVQRIGRVGRRGIDSEVYLVVPEPALEAYIPRSRLDYWGLVDAVRGLYPDYPKRKRDVSKLIPGSFHELRRKLIASLGLASLARVSGMRQFYGKIHINRDDALTLLNRVVGGPKTYTSLLVFRRTGFTVEYMVSDTGENGETSIGLIARNFRIKSVTRDGKIVIDLARARTPIRVRVVGDPSPFSGKFVDLRLFLKILKGRIELGENHSLDEDQVEDTLVYVSDTGEKTAEYLSYTGEGAEILSPSGRRYSLIFI